MSESTRGSLCIPVDDNRAKVAVNGVGGRVCCDRQDSILLPFEGQRHHLPLTTGTVNEVHLSC